VGELTSANDFKSTLCEIKALSMKRPFLSKVDEFVPRTQNVNVEIVRERWLLDRNVQRFRGGLVCKAHRLKSRRGSNKEEKKVAGIGQVRVACSEWNSSVMWLGHPGLLLLYFSQAYELSDTQSL